MTSLRCRQCHANWRSFRQKITAIFCWLLPFILPAAIPFGHAAAPVLKVSENKRFLVTEDGQPFFYLGDTAWELFHRLNREEADAYLRERERIRADVRADAERRFPPQGVKARLLARQRSQS